LSSSAKSSMSTGPFWARLRMCHFHRFVSFLNL
jgi:hypothetical protein